MFVLLKIDKFVQIDSLIHSNFGSMLNSHQVVSVSSTGEHWTSLMGQEELSPTG